jgi:WD40 repeat protein
MAPYSMRVGLTTLLLFLPILLHPRALGEDAPKKEHTDVFGDPLPPDAVARLGTERFRVGERIRQLALSADGKFVAAYHHDRASALRGDTVVLLDAVTGKEVRRFNMEEHIGECLAFSPDVKLLASADRDAGIRLLDVATGNLVRRFPSLGQGTRPILHFSDNGKVLAVGNEGSHNDRIVAWDVNSGKELCRFQNLHDPGLTASLSANGAVLAMRENNDDGQNPSSFIQLWDTVANRELRRLNVREAQRLGIVNIALSPDGKQLAVCDVGATIKLVETETGKQLRKFAARSGTGALLSFSRDGKRLAAATRDGVVQVWDPAAGKLLVQAKGQSCPCFGVAFTGVSDVLAAGLRFQSVLVWDVSSGKVRGPDRGHQAAVTAVAFLESGNRIISVGRDGIRAWSAATGEQLHHIPHLVPEEERGRGLPEIFFLSPDGKYLVAGRHFAGAVRLVKVETGEEICALGGPSGEDPSAGFSADGKKLATVDGWRRQTPRIRFFDLTSGEEVRSFDATPSAIHCLALSPDGKSLAEATSSQLSPDAQCVVRTLDTTTGKEIRMIAQGKGRIQRISYSPFGKILAATGPEGTHLWNAATGVEITLWKGSERHATSNLAFSSDGRLLAVAVSKAPGEPPELLVWEVASGSPRHELSRSHHGEIHALAFSPDNRKLVSGGADTTVLVWDLAGRSAAGTGVQGKLTSKETLALWTALADEDAAKGHRAMVRLAADPTVSVILLKQQLKPVPTVVPNEHEIEKWIGNLNDESFAKREQASQELERIGRPAKQTLEKVLAAEPEAEKRRRIEAILKDMNSPRLKPEEVRSSRAVELLERLNTSESRELLATLARGAPDARLTRQAKAALERLAKR